MKTTYEVVSTIYHKSQSLFAGNKVDLTFPEAKYHLLAGRIKLPVAEPVEPAQADPVPETVTVEAETAKPAKRKANDSGSADL